MHLIRLHGAILRTYRKRMRGRGCNELFLDRNNYQNSNGTEWKLVISNVSISNFITIPTAMIFLRPKNPQYSCTSKELGR